MQITYRISWLRHVAVFPLLLIGWYTNAQQPIPHDDDPTTAIVLQQALNDPRVQNRIHELVSSIVSSEDGQRVYVAWYTGGSDEGTGNYVTVALSTDQGNTWRNDELVIYPSDTTIRIYDPALWRDRDGKIWLFYTSVSEGKFWDLRGGVHATQIDWDGSKVTYTKPVRLADGVMMNKPVYISQQDFVLFPISVWHWRKQFRKGQKEVKPDTVPIPDGSFIHKFDYKSGKRKIDRLHTYSKLAVLPDSMRTYDEHQVVQISDNGELLCFLRAEKGIYYAYSTDFGKTWTSLIPFTLTGPTPSARIHISKLHSGNLLLILNDAPTRTNMTAFLSEDGGKTWPYKLLLDKRKKVSYPDASQSNDGYIHVTHDRDRFGARDILYLRFTEDDIRQGNEDNIFRKRVNPK